MMAQQFNDNAARGAEISYPRQIQGDLRIILQTKDLFLRAYRLLDEYRRMVNDQMEFITKDFVEDQILMGENELMQLKAEARDFEQQVQTKMAQNDNLCLRLQSMGYGNIDTSSPRRMLYCRSPFLRARLKYKNRNYEIDLLEGTEIALTDTVKEIITIQNDIRVRARSLIDFYHDMFTLQIHFNLIITQLCSYCMPLVTEPIGILDRAFFWSYRPEVELVRRNAEVTDRLKDIYTSVQYHLNTLAEGVTYLQQRIHTQKQLEKVFKEKVNEQQRQKDVLLRKVHCVRQDIDIMDEENDRMVGLIVKTDPTFINSDEFHRLTRHLEGRCPWRYAAEVEPQKAELISPPRRRTSKHVDAKQETDNSEPLNLGEVIVSGRSTGSLKDKLMHRTKSMFEAALQRMDDAQLANLQSFKGGIVAELSEVTSSSSDKSRRSQSRRREKRESRESNFRNNMKNRTPVQIDDIKVTATTKGENGIIKVFSSDDTKGKRKSKSEIARADGEDVRTPSSVEVSAQLGFSFDTDRSA